SAERPVAERLAQSSARFVRQRRSGPCARAHRHVLRAAVVALDRAPGLRLRCRSVTTDPSRLAEVEAIYESGRYVDAFVELRKMGGPLRLTDPAALVLASRIMGNLAAAQT